jgi:hypothetical protein
MRRTHRPAPTNRAASAAFLSFHPARKERDMSAEKIAKGDKVKWRWGAGEAEGVVDEVFTARVTRCIKGKGVTRKASARNPAFMVKQEGGARALKSGSELTKAG